MKSKTVYYYRGREHGLWTGGGIMLTQRPLEMPIEQAIKEMTQDIKGLFGVKRVVIK